MMLSSNDVVLKCKKKMKHRFDGEDLLERFRGKKIMFIGDSISINQWESLACLLHAALPNSTIIQQSNDTFRTIQFKVSLIYCIPF